jgi:hypothetical protein
MCLQMMGHQKPEVSVMKTKLGFILGTGAAIAGIGLSSYAISYAQWGPGWEVPARAGTQLFVFPIISILLGGVAVSWYFLASCSQLKPRSLRYWFWGLVALSFALAASIYLFDPGQWPRNNGYLSSVVKVVSTPVLAVCVIAWVMMSVTVWKSGTVNAGLDLTS